MIKKTKTESTGKKRKGGKKSARKKMDAAQVREDLAGIIKSEAKNITEAVMGKAMQGELAPARYLLELAGVYPPSNDGEQADEEEDCLAKTLLNRLNAPRKAEGQEFEEKGGKIKDSGDVEEDAAQSVVG